MKETIKKLKLRKAAIRTWLAHLHAEDRQIERAIKAIRALPVPVSVAIQPAKKRMMSAATKAKLTAAQKARWAKINAAKAKK